MGRTIKIKWLFISFFGLCLVFGSSLPTVNAVPVQQEDFEQGFDEDGLQGWDIAPEATTVDGKLRLYGGSFALKPGRWGDQETQIRLWVTAEEGEIIIHYFANEGISYNLILVPDRLILEKGFGPENVLVLADAPFQRPVGDWVELKLRVENGSHSVSIGEEEILSAIDPDPLQPGGFGFRYFGPDYLDIDSITLNVLGETAGVPVLEEDVEAEPTETTVPVLPQSEGQFLDTLQSLFTTRDTQIDLLTFVTNLILSVVMAFILGRVYIHWGGSLSNRRKFASNFMLMTVTTTFIILVVRSSVALSLGLVGALSIVRFRTAVKEPEELAYLFFAIGLGIGLGDNQRLITLVAFGVAILVLGLLKLFRHGSADVNLHLTVSGKTDGDLTLERIITALDPHTSKIKLMRLDETDQVLEADFLVEFRAIEDLNQAKSAVQALAPHVSVTFLDNKGIW